jgi:Tfp pilus assembly protein PilX
MSPFPKTLQIPRPPRRNRGVALITVLSLVVIVSLILVAFVAAMRLERAASYSYSQSVAAEQVARGAMNLVVSELQNEMARDAAPDLTYPARPLHTNVTSSNIMPQLVGTNAAMPNLLKISGTALSFTGSLASGKLAATAVSSTAPAKNGRYIDTNRWSLPQLGAFPNNASAPNWVVLTRSGATNASGLGFGPSGNTLNNPAPGNPNFAIGRFAYAVYDVGGLLDITVAGYPGTLTPAQIGRIKGGLAGVRLAPTNVAVTQDDLIAWRNPASRTDYVSYVTNFQMTNASGAVYPGDNAFVSRQDLIKAARDGVAGLSTNALTNLTIFSRDKNAPSWGPGFNSADLGGTNAAAFAYKNNASVSTAAPFSAASPNPNRFLPGARFAAAATLTDYQLDGTSFTYDVAPGDPVVSRRFPLRRLAWIGPNGPQNGGTAASIQAAFGLVWGPSEDPDLAGANVWKYAGPSGSTEQPAIKTLGEVAAEGRNPNFFELLQAAVLRGSLGVNGGSAWYSTHQSFPALQIFRIGAALIDQYDEDAYPTVIEYKQSGYSWLACGVESLPLVSAITPIFGAPQTPAQSEGQTSATAAVYLGFNLWNPHRTAAANPPPVRLRVRGSVGVYNMYGNSSSLPETLGSKNEPGFVADLDASVELSAQGRQGFLASTTLGTGDVTAHGDVSDVPATPDSGLWVQAHPLGTDKNDEVVALRLSDFPFQLGASSQITVDAYGSVKISLGYDTNSPFNTCMEFQSPSGAWIPYQFATGLNDPVTWIRNSTGNYYVVSASYAKNNPRPADASIANRIGNFISYLTNDYPAGWSYNDSAGRWYRAATNGPLDAVPGGGPISLEHGNTWDRSLIYCSNDPRSVRFGLWVFVRGGPEMKSAAARATLWAAANTASPYEKGFGGDSSKVQGKPSIFGSNYFPAQLARNNYGSATAISDTDNTVTRTGAGTDTSYADNDGLRRTADAGLFVDTSAGTGNPFERPEDRPVILNRPFQSVGEMGFAFRDSPWRTLDFFSRKTADAALLDVFTLQDATQEVVTGRINLNAKNPVVFEAVLANVVSDPVTETVLGSPDSLAGTITQYTATNRIVNKSDLAGIISPLLSPATGATTSTNFASNDEQNIKYRREAFVRALADVGQTRTWNLMIDVIAQAGRYGPAAAGPDQFLVEAERRCWLHVAIDRFTGEILDQRMEVVVE